MKNILRILLFLLFVSTSSLYAQVYYPVVARVTQTPPYSAYLTDYSNPAQTNLSIQIQQNDRDIASRAIKLKIFIEGQGFNIESTDVVQGAPSLTLTYGQVYNLSAAEVANYFKQYNLKVNPNQYSQPFSEGTLRFGVQVLDFQTNRALSGVQWGTPVWIALNEPPVWIMPQNETEFTPSPVQNVVFQWAPRHTNVNDVEYEFTLKELVFNSYSMGNIQNVFLSQPTFYTTRTTSTSLAYNSLMPPLVEGRVYAYRVRAIAKRGLQEVGLFRNNGFSEVQALFYGEPMRLMKAPVITGLTRDELTNITSLDWKGEANHTNFTVAYREKNTNQSWIGHPVLSIPHTSVYTYTFTNLNPAKSYEIRVGAQDKYKQSAYSESVYVDSLTSNQIKDVEIKGKVFWAFQGGEEEVSDKSAIGSKEGTIGRTIDEKKATQKVGNNKYPLSNAKLSLISSDLQDINLDNIDSATYELIRTFQANDVGEYTYTTTNLKLLKDEKVFYMLVEYGPGPFTREILKIGKLRDLTSVILLQDIVLKANSFRYTPKLIHGLAKNIDFEDVSLYRLKVLSEQHTYLSKEGNVKGNRSEMLHNNHMYEKVADFLVSSTVGALIANSYFNDNYVLRIKESGKKAIVVPVNTVSKVTDGVISHITDRIAYLSVLHTIEGYVKKGNEAVHEAIVQAFGKSVLTDRNGYYSMDIPDNTGSSFEIKVIDPLNANSFIKEKISFTKADIRRDFELNNKGFYLEARVLDEQQKPVLGAAVLVGGTMLKTDVSGWFSYSGSTVKLPKEIKIILDGYDELALPLSAFNKVSLPEETAAAAFAREVKNPGLAASYYDHHFTKQGWMCSDVFSLNTVPLSRTYKYRIITFREKTQSSFNIVNLKDSVEFISGNITVDGQTVAVSKGSATVKNSKIVGTGGYMGIAKNPYITVKALNGSGLPQRVEEEIQLNFPETASVNDTTTFLVQLKEGVMFNGVVMDSTIYIEGLHVPGTLKKRGERLNPVPDVWVEVSGGSRVKTDNSGKFKTIVPVGKDLVFGLTKSGFFKTTKIISYEESNNHKSTAKEFFMLQIDTNSIPDIKKLHGFDVIVDRLIVHSSEVTNDKSDEEIRTKGNRTYKITGKIVITPGGENRFKVKNATNLSFKDIIVRLDEKNSKNAVLVYDFLDFTNASVNVLLFDYAPVKVTLPTLVPMEGHENEGVIGAGDFTFTQTKMAGLEFGKMKLKESEEETYSFFDLFKKGEDSQDASKDDGKKPLFASLPLKILSENTEYQIVFGSKVSVAALKKEKVDENSGPYYRAPFAQTNISGVYSAMNMFIDHNTATLNSEGISLDGYFTLPKIWMLKNEGAIRIKNLSITKDFKLEGIEFAKNPKAKKQEITKLAVANKWIFYVNSLGISNEFKGFSLSGTFNTDKENYLNVDKFELNIVSGEFVPKVSVSTSEKGLTFASIKFTTLPNKTISFIRNIEEESYEIKAAFKMEYDNNKGVVHNTIKRITANIFPLTVNEFFWSTNGKLLVAVSKDKPVELGPVKVAVRSMVYTKGGAITKEEMQKYVTSGWTKEQMNAEMKRIAEEKTFSRFKTPEDRAVSNLESSDPGFVEEIALEVAAEDPAANWAFGFAGGVQVTSNSVKGMDFKSDMAFYLGRFSGNQIDYFIDKISFRLESSAFTVEGALGISTSPEKMGFKCDVAVKTKVRDFSGSFYYYKFNDGGGIELGASLVASVEIPMGSITWTSIGGGFDLNTKESKYKFYFKGSARNSAISKNLVEYKDILVSMEFNTKECGGKPIIKGSMNLFVNKSRFCSSSIELDFCQMRIIGKIDCETEIVKSHVKGTVKALVIATEKSFLTGCYVNVNVLGMTRQVTFALGVNFNTLSTDPTEVARYAKAIPAYLKHDDNVTFSGIFFEYMEIAEFKTSGSVKVEVVDLVSYDLSALRWLTITFGINFNNGVFEVRSKASTLIPTLYFSASVSILGYRLNGAMIANVEFVGGRNNDVGWHITAKASGKIVVYTDKGKDFGCNTISVKKEKHTIFKYPCGIKCSWTWKVWETCKTKWCDVKADIPHFWEGIGVKVCIGGSVEVTYREKGSRAGWKINL